MAEAMNIGDKLQQMADNEGGKRSAEESSTANNKRPRGDGVKVSFRLLIPSSNAGGIIGKEGSNINQMRKKYNATITVPDCSGPERILTVTTDMEAALDCIQEIIPILDEQVGAHIKVYSDVCPNSTDRVVQVGGMLDKVVDALRELQKLINTTPIKGPAQPYDPYCFEPFCALNYGGYAGPENKKMGGGGGMGRGFRGGRYGGGGQSMGFDYMGGGGAYGGGRKIFGHPPMGAGRRGGRGGGGPGAGGGRMPEPLVDKVALKAWTLALKRRLKSLFLKIVLEPSLAREDVGFVRYEPRVELRSRLKILNLVLMNVLLESQELKIRLDMLSTCCRREQAES